jgi:hypothetical protein
LDWFPPLLLLGCRLMSFKSVGHCLFAGGVLLSLSLPFATQSAVAQDATQVLTPLGYRDKANVHKVPRDYDLIRMPDEHIRMQNRITGHYIDFPKPVATNQIKPSFTDKGWVTFASWLNQWGLPITYFGTDWIVPPPPATYDGQTIFQFNGIQPLDSTAILQPVLQYGPSAAGGGKLLADRKLVRDWKPSLFLRYDLCQTGSVPGRDD